uniref:Uncharacterized protein n=1 Tax=Opuntia streptacantha TaxID=393608 RepID=A0A7C9AL38_OPUST
MLAPTRRSNQETLSRSNLITSGGTYRMEDSSKLTLMDQILQQARWQDLSFVVGKEVLSWRGHVLWRMRQFLLRRLQLCEMEFAPLYRPDIGSYKWKEIIRL